MNNSAIGCGTMSDRNTSGSGIADILSHLRDASGGKPAIRTMHAPGRVNLIGEHTDYNGYPVLPVAIDRSIVLAFQPLAHGQFVLGNLNPAFESRSFSLEEITVPYEQGDWGNYVKAAVRGLVESNHIDAAGSRGFSGYYAGTIPESAGLSSSSALVVVSALACLEANGVIYDPIELATILAQSERYAGLEGGGMDQAISLSGIKDHALRIDFFPLRITPVPMPAGYSIVVCNSMVRASKTDSARYEYNRRVVECRLAKAMLLYSLRKNLGGDFSAGLLADLDPDVLGIEKKTVFDLAEEIMYGASLTVPEIARRIDIEADELLRGYCMIRDEGILEPPADGFQIHNRYRHVTSEATRVDKAERALRSGDWLEFAKCVNESHVSCRDDFEVSCPELEELVNVALEHGAAAARLTGAGFGGCTVNLVPEQVSEDFIRNMITRYYEGYLGMRAPEGTDRRKYFQDAVFLCSASSGAGELSAGSGKTEIRIPGNSI